MKTDINSCSTCPPGHEKYEPFIYRSWPKDKEYIQYDYRHTDGELFTCVARDLENARYRRNNWLKAKNENA